MKSIKNYFLRMALCLLFLASPLYGYKDADEFWRDVSPVNGPKSVDLGANARIFIPKGYIFLRKKDAAKFRAFSENLPNPKSLGVIMPENFAWWAEFEYEDSGYIKEEKIDAEEVFNAYKKSENYANEERERLGYKKLFLKGWFFKPAYNSYSKNLEWALSFVNSDNEPVVNFETRILGRTGYMRSTLVMAPDNKMAVNEFQQIISEFSFKEGYRYSEWRSGDKVAEYGLSALITGGVIAVAAKTGLLAHIAKFWKLIVVGAVGAFGFIAKLFGKKN